MENNNSKNTTIYGGKIEQQGGFVTGVDKREGENQNTNNTNVAVSLNNGIINADTLIRNINEAQPKNLTETAAEIQQLLQQLEQSNPTETTAEQMAVVAQAVEIVENNPRLKQRVIGALKSSGIQAFKEALDNPIANILVAAFQGWIKP
ncbi:MAG: hypothetical protein F6K24_39055 [Okeania sp. SIO2D1]|uniref:hypothetical protein n=1 Tax=Okeania sp. SIO2C9 TaxID=2607791 RepID=UPI0013BCE804|nr:hypothetical protein [Okeania sp. SIO2C9]NEQ74125.1 hypothetical protein [Okeania sp. SIO2C9]NES70790.1 hypothetical protein [Okeania sp. SIO2D1]